MDEFFEKTKCDRCGQTFNGPRIMSMFNEECICMECKANEMLLPEYSKAVEAEKNELAKGNSNYVGIGLPKKPN